MVEGVIHGRGEVNCDVGLLTVKPDISKLFHFVEKVFFDDINQY